MKTEKSQPQPDSQFQKASQRLEAYLREHQMRKTPERFALLREALQLEGHFSIHQLMEAMERRNYHVSRATVYNTVELLCDCGVMRRQMLVSGQALYECRTGNHVHLVCEGCGKIKEINHPELSRMLISLKHPSFKTSYFSATLYGYCNNCLRKSKKANK